MLQRHTRLYRHHRLLLPWLAAAAAAVSFLIYQKSAGGALGPLGTDGVALNVPSPGTLGLMAVGCIALIPWRGRRRRHRV